VGQPAVAGRPEDACEDCTDEGPCPRHGTQLGVPPSHAIDNLATCARQLVMGLCPSLCTHAAFALLTHRLSSKLVLLTALVTVAVDLLVAQLSRLCEGLVEGLGGWLGMWLLRQQL
jgi:hypothetical protein